MTAEPTNPTSDPCPRCGAPLVTVIFGLPGAPSCIACLWPDPERREAVHQAGLFDEGAA